MSYLLYSSEEMFSATELLRKSKNIFDKISTEEIDKAIILRDGRPTFLLFDFKKYESIMKDYEYYKSFYNTYNNSSLNSTIEKKTVLNERVIEAKDETMPIEVKRNNSEVEVTKSHIDDDFIVELSTEIQNENLSGEIKEFWNE